MLYRSTAEYVVHPQTTINFFELDQQLNPELIMAAQTNEHTHPLRVCVFDNMRARSHIFARLFSEHPQIQQVYHPFMMASFLGPERMTAHTKHSERREKEVNEDWLPLYVPDTYGTSRKWLEDQVHEIERKVCSIIQC